MTASVYAHIRNFHLSYLKQFQMLGWETHVGCAGIPGGVSCIDRGIELPFKKKFFSMDNLRATHMLRKTIKGGDYDLIITHTTLASFYTRLAVKGMKRRPKVICVMHGYLFDDDSPLVKRLVMRWAEQLTAPQTDLLLVMNAWDEQTARRYRLGKRIVKIPGMGVDFSKLDAATCEDGVRLRREFGIADDAFVLIYAAEFSERKSQHVLIRAMRQLPGRVVLALCGSGATLQACRDLAEASGVSDRVLFPGQVDDVAAWYQMADACVSSSRSEGLPFNLMEAMHMGLPVVASAVKGHVDLIREAETGLLYPYGDVDAFAKQVSRLLDDRALADRLAAQARKCVSEYDASIARPQVMRYYLEAGSQEGTAI